jgi:Glutathione-dependent formaldehyde-activating enzyme
MKVQGQCHCGAIRYEAEVEPDTIAICHCLDCQRLSGSAFRANVPAPADGFRISQESRINTSRPPIAEPSGFMLSVRRVVLRFIPAQLKNPLPIRCAWVH